MSIPLSSIASNPHLNEGAKFESDQAKRTPNSLKQVASQKITRQFRVAAEKHDSIDGFLREASNVVSTNVDVLALWIAKDDENGDFSQIHSISDQNSATVWQLVDQTVQQITPYVAQSEQICSCALEKSEHHQIIAAPVINDGKLQYILIGCFSTRKQTVVRQQWLMGLFSQAASNWFQTRQLEQLNVRNKSLSDALTLIQSLDKTQNLRQSSMSIVNHLRTLCDAEQVAISFCHRPKIGQLTAISDVESVELTSESNKLINTACNQAILEQQLLVYPDPENEHTAAQLPLDQYCKSNRHTGCINIPLTTSTGNTLGAILIAMEKEKLTPEFVAYLQRLTEMITGHLDIVLRANRGIKDLFKTKLLELSKAKWTRPILTACAVALAVLCVPVQYRVPCECELQPVMRRFIAAPYDGILEQTLVDSGDVVHKDQVLAKMDGRQLRIELAGLRAEKEGAKKKRDSALATSDYAASQIAASEMKRLGSEIELLEQRITNLEIRSPIAGIIVNGDLEKVEGAPLETGQTLYEVGPIDKMLAEVAIPESEIHYVEKGMTVDIKLNSFPFKNWEGTVERIHPRAEIIDDASVFIAEVQLKNGDLMLRPGLEGSAKVRSKNYPLGWNLFHTAWESVRYWTIW